MTRKNLGLGLLSLWAGFNLVLAIGIVAAITLGGALPPAVLLFLPEPIVSSAPDEVIALFRSMALLMNVSIAVNSGVALALTWRGIRRGDRWAWWVAVLALGWVQLGGFLSDVPLGSVNLMPNVISATVLVLGAVASWPVAHGSRTTPRSAG